MNENGKNIKHLTFEEIVTYSREEQHLIPIKIENKDEYYSDLWDVVDSQSGRADIIYSNNFFFEAKNLITNAIVLLEKGYFDCAFYSLRQSIEVSLTIAFLADDNDVKSRSQKHREWNNKEYFPVVSKMTKLLNGRKLNYSDIKDKMSIFFEKLDQEMDRMNKYVHKQGYDTFYNHKSAEKINELKKDFISSLEMSISAIAIHRLVIDPLPLLLIDHTIYQKSGDMVTKPFSQDFLNKYLSNYVDQFKATQMYIDYFNYFISKETMSPSILDIVKNQFVNREKFEEICSQVHLLTIYDRLAIAHFILSTKITKMYIGAIGLFWYFSDVKSNRISTGFDSNNLNSVKASNQKINYPFDNVFQSYFRVIDEDIFLEHNAPLDEEEIESLKIVYNQFEVSLEEANEKIEDLIKKSDE
jgi:hypothetical protein